RAGYPRTTGPLSNRSWLELESAFVQARRLEQTQRPRAWKNTPLPTDDALRHLRDYLRGCAKLGRTMVGHERLAPQIHELVGRGGYLASAPMPGPPAPEGAKASQLAAHISGASWGAGATAHAQAWRRARPRQLTAPNDSFVP